MIKDIIPPKTKVNNAELQDRYDLVITLLAKGLKRAQILVNPTVLSWRMSNGTIDKYLQKAKGEIIENSQQARTEHLGRGVMNLDYLYKCSLDTIEFDNKTGKPIGDNVLPAINTCLNIQKEKNKLLQLSSVYDPAKKKKAVEVMPDEVKKMLDSVTIVNAPVPEGIDLDAEFGKQLIAGNSD